MPTIIVVKLVIFLRKCVSKPAGNNLSVIGIKGKNMIKKSFSLRNLVKLTESLIYPVKRVGKVANISIKNIPEHI